MTNILPKLDPPFFSLALGQFEVIYNQLIERFSNWLESPNGFPLLVKSLPTKGNQIFLIFRYNPYYKPFTAYEPEGRDSIAITLPSGLTPQERDCYPIDTARIKSELVSNFNQVMLSTFSKELRRREFLIQEMNKEGTIKLKPTNRVRVKI